MPEPFSRTIAAYLRVASLAVATYDYLETFPTAWRFYKEHYRSRRISLSSLLFVLIRCTSVTVLTVSNVGFFYGRFTVKTCGRFFLLAPVWKVLQVMVSQAILGVRAWNLSRRSHEISYLLLFSYAVACIVQWFFTLYQRKFKLGSEPYGNCVPLSVSSERYAWIYYAVAVGYDFLTTTISVAFLLKYKLNSNSTMVSRLTSMMLYDGIGYFIVLVAVNILNLLLYKQDHDIQTAGASLAYCVSWIMSQRLLIHLYNAMREHRDRFESVTITHDIDSPRDVSRTVRTFEQKSTGAFSIPLPDMDEFSTRSQVQQDARVQVRIERTVKLDRRLRTFELENYSQIGGRSRDTTTEHR